MLKQFVLNILQWLSLTLNAWTGGDPEEPFSARMGKAIQEGRCILCRPFCALLSVVLREPEHCLKSADRHAEEGKDEVVQL